MMKQRFLSIGECMVEMAPTDDGDYRLGFAGDTLNTAWYARQTFGNDWDIAYFTAVGEDEVSRRMRDFIADAEINTEFIRELPDCTVGLYLIQLQDGERSFSYWRSTSAARRLANDPAVLKIALTSADQIYFSGITLAILSPKDRVQLLKAISQARRHGATVVFDPNLRPRLWDAPETMRQVVMYAAAVSDIILPSFDDEAQFFGDATTAETADRYAEAGAALIVVKNGSGEIISFHGGETLSYTPPPVTSVVDTTAAGDSFNAGFLASYAEHKDLPAAMAAGAALAAKVIQNRGALVES